MSDPNTKMTTTGDGAPSSMTTREFSRKEVELLKRTIAQDATDEELSMFIQNCKRYGLDPFTGQIHAVKRWDSNAGREVMSVQVGIDGFRLIADRTGKWRGTVGPYWCDQSGEWTDVWLKDEYPAAAKVGVLRSDFSEPRWGIARWDAYVATKKNGNPTFMWRKMPAHMLAKCAEALALRSAFPNDLSGLYTDAEMDQAGDQDKRTYDGPDPQEVTEAEIVQKSSGWYESGIEAITKKITAGDVDPADVDTSSVPKSHPIDEWPDEYREDIMGVLSAGKATNGSASTTTSTDQATTKATATKASLGPQEVEEYEDADAALAANFDEAWQSDERDWGSISEGQLRRMYAIAEENGWSEAALNRMIKDELGYESKADVPYGDPYDEICEALEDERLRYHMSRDPDTKGLFEGGGGAGGDEDDSFEDAEDELPF